MTIKDIKKCKYKKIIPNEKESREIDILKNEYNILYNYRRELYEEIYRISQNNKRREKQKYFEEIMEEMNYEKNDSIITSVNRLKYNYSELYKLNS